MRENRNSIFAFLELPDYLTLLGGVFGIVAMIASINAAYLSAAVFMILSVLCDFYDGKLARLIDRKNKVFGEVLDTSVDTVSFVVTPVIYGYSLGLNSTIAIALMIVFAMAALLRLARFSCVKTTDKGYFLGMPVTYNNLIFPISYLAMHAIGFDGFITILFSILFAVTTILMSSTIKWIKF
jgi:CDP-diacylglycerol--serine O-phosphatidyltransferase